MLDGPAVLDWLVRIEATTIQRHLPQKSFHDIMQSRVLEENREHDGCILRS